MRIRKGEDIVLKVYYQEVIFSGLATIFIVSTFPDAASSGRTENAADKSIFKSGSRSFEVKYGLDKPIRYSM